MAGYEKQRNWEQTSHNKATAGAQDVRTDWGKPLDRGPLKPRQRKAAEKSFLRFCKTYGKEAFFLECSPNHLRAAELIEAAVRSGEMFAFAMPRGSGKTTLARWAVIWAVLCGHSPYSVLISATQKSAE